MTSNTGNIIKNYWGIQVIIVYANTWFYAQYLHNHGSTMYRENNNLLISYD